MSLTEILRQTRLHECKAHMHSFETVKTRMKQLLLLKKLDFCPKVIGAMAQNVTKENSESA